MTGALGHIGSRFIRDLPLQFPEAEVVLIDNLMTQRYCSLFNLPEMGSFQFIEGDVTTMPLGVELENADVVVHLAAITDAAGSFEKSDEVERNNFRGTLAIAEACSKTSAAMVHFSSTSVYGTQDESVDEECPEGKLKPQSPYAVAKLREEKMLQKMHKEGKLRCTVFRFGTIFGKSEGMRFHTAVNKFCWQAVMGRPLTVWKTAYDQRRPYLDLLDGVRAINFLIRNEIFDGGIYNVLTKNATVREVVETIKLVVPELKITFVDSPIMNQLSYDVSSTRFRDLGFETIGDIETGLRETIELLRNANYKIS